MEDKRKYWVVLAGDSQEFEDKLNALAEAGYDLRYIEAEGIPFAVMKLSNSPDLAQAEDMVRIDLETNADITPKLVKKLREGWIITSEYSKAVQLMRVK